jgi:transposase
VSKDRLDVAVRPPGESLIFKRTGVGDRRSHRPGSEPYRRRWWRIEATGGFEAVVAAGLAGAGLPVVVVNPAQVRAFAQARAGHFLLRRRKYSTQGKMAAATNQLSS